MVSEDDFKNVFIFIYFQSGTTPSVSASTTASVEDTKTSSSPIIQIEIPEKQSSAEPISRERTISVTSVPDQQEVPNSETTAKTIIEAAALPAEVKANTSDNKTINQTLEPSNSSSAIIHPASSSVSVEESIGKSDSDIHSEDSEYNIFYF